MSLEPYVIGIQFQKVGKMYYFDSSEFREINTGDFVVVDTSRGRQIGQVAGGWNQERGIITDTNDVRCK